MSIEGLMLVACLIRAESIGTPSNGLVCSFRESCWLLIRWDFEKVDVIPDDSPKSTEFVQECEVNWSVVEWVVGSEGRKVCAGLSIHFPTFFDIFMVVLFLFQVSFCHVPDCSATSWLSQFILKHFVIWCNVVNPTIKNPPNHQRSVV